LAHPFGVDRWISESSLFGMGNLTSKGCSGSIANVHRRGSLDVSGEGKSDSDTKKGVMKSPIYHPKTNMTIKHPPFGDVFPIENGDFPMSS